MILKPSRRDFLRLGLAAIAAPAIVRATSLMPIKAVTFSDTMTFYDVPLDGLIANHLYDISFHGPYISVWDRGPYGS